MKVLKSHGESIMKVGFVGVGKLGKDAAEVIATKYDVVGYDIAPVDTTLYMAKTLEEASIDKDIIFVETKRGSVWESLK